MGGEKRIRTQGTGATEPRRVCPVPKARRKPAQEAHPSPKRGVSPLGKVRI